MATKQEVEKQKSQRQPPREDVVSLANEFIELFNQRDWTRMREILHPKYTFIGGDGQIQNGPEASLTMCQMYASGFSDAKLTLQRQFVAGDTVILELIGTGTHDGELLGVPPSNRRVKMVFCSILEIKDGKIFAERQYMDMQNLMQQMGVGSITH